MGVPGLAGDDVYALLDVVIKPLGESGIPYMLVGALATFAWGDPRTTRDVDLLIDVTGKDEATIREVLRRTGLQVQDPITNDFGRVIRLTGGFLPVEVFLGGKGSVQARELERRKPVALGGRSYHVLSPEDLILRKLVNLKVRRKDTDVLDLHAIVFKQWGSLDLAYLREHCVAQRVCGALDRIFETARVERLRSGLPT